MEHESKGQVGDGEETLPRTAGEADADGSEPDPLFGERIIMEFPKNESRHPLQV